MFSCVAGGYYLKANQAVEDNNSLFKKQVVARVSYLALVPGTLVANVADTVLGLLERTVFNCTLGKYGNDFAINLASFEKIVSQPYANLIKVINPKAKFDNYFYRNRPQNGKCFVQVKKYFDKKVGICAGSKSFLKKQVATRLTLVLKAVASILARLADAVLGVGYAALSIITVGKYEKFNNNALVHLKIPNVVKDIVDCGSKIFGNIDELAEWDLF